MFLGYLVTHIDGVESGISYSIYFEEPKNIYYPDDNTMYRHIQQIYFVKFMLFDEIFSMNNNINDFRNYYKLELDDYDSYKRKYCSVYMTNWEALICTIKNKIYNKVDSINVDGNIMDLDIDWTSVEELTAQLYQNMHSIYINKNMKKYYLKNIKNTVKINIIK